jgi:hypothetical protein
MVHTAVLYYNHTDYKIDYAIKSPNKATFITKICFYKNSLIFRAIRATSCDAVTKMYKGKQK